MQGPQAGGLLPSLADDAPDDEGMGVYFRALRSLFSIATERANEITYTFECSLLEIYNEKIIDLLTANNKKNTTVKKLKVVKGEHGMVVDGLVIRQVGPLFLFLSLSLSLS
jgi:hypothetical protein